MRAHFPDQEGTNMDDVTLSDEAIALTDAMKGLIEIFLAAQIAKPAVFDRIYGEMRDAKLAKECVRGASIMEMLRQFATDPARNPLRGPPQGTA
jgi:hypothetical protein